MSTKNTPLLFGVGVTSLSMFSTGYRDFLRRRNSRRKHPIPLPSMRYVGFARINLPDTDLYLVETVATLVAMRSHFAVGAAVVVSDSPVLLSELPGLRPLDWTGGPTSFLLREVDWAAFETARTVDNTVPWTDVVPDRIDRLGLVIEETTGGLLSTPLIGICAQLNFVDQQLFRSALARYLSGAQEVKAFHDTARNLVAQATGDKSIAATLLSNLVAVLKTTGPLYRAACASLRDKKNPVRMLKDTEVSLFEARYFSRFVNTYAPVGNAAAPVEQPAS